MDTPRNTVRTDPRRQSYTFGLTLGSRVDLVAETHDGDTTTLTLRRRPRVELVK